MRERGPGFNHRSVTFSVYLEIGQRKQVFDRLRRLRTREINAVCRAQFDVKVKLGFRQPGRMLVCFPEHT